MILLVNPRATRPKNRRFPLSVMSLGAVLPEGVTWKILDGNIPDADLLSEASEEISRRHGTDDPVSLVAVTVMPGPQLVAAVPFSRELKARFPAIPIVWGGYFPTLYPDPCLTAAYVDWIVRGQGERTFLELLDVLDGRKSAVSVAGLGWKDGPTPRVNPERRWEGPDAFPDPPYDRIDVGTYLHPTYLGERSAVHQASIGCPYTCNFCGVIAAWGSLEKFASPARTERVLALLSREHGADSVHFYDNNFFLKEDHARDVADRLAPLGLRFWCEARIDVMVRFSDATWEAIRRAGFRMIYFGAESGSDDVLRKMSKNLTTEETLALAERARGFGIVPEFSFMFGDPDDPAGEAEQTLAFLERLRAVNPAMKLISYFYTPTPQRRGTYGGIDPSNGAPDTLEEWVTPEWLGWMTHENPRVPWLTDELRARVDGFTRSFGGVGPSAAEAYGHLRDAS